MARLRIRLLALVPLAFLGLALVRLPSQAAPATAVRSLRLQQVGEVTYFHVQLETPKGMLPDAEAELVPQDDQAHHVCQRRLGRAGAGGTPGAAAAVPAVSGEGVVVEGAGPGLPPAPPAVSQERAAPAQPESPRGPAPVEGLEFVGQATGTGVARLLLVYPAESRLAGRLLQRDRNTARPLRWREMSITLDFSTAQKVPLPREARQRREKPAAKPAPGQRQMVQQPVFDDLEGLWAVAQVDHLAGRVPASSDFGYYAFAAQTVARKYNVPPPWNAQEVWTRRGADRVALGNPHLYETTTGATAIAESLQLQRLLTRDFRDQGKRTLPIDRVQGITIAEHPWKEMIGEKKAAAEPLARLIPNDNYYIAFKSAGKLLEFHELLEQWGTSLQRGYELHSRDQRLAQRYQQQLCLRSTQLGRLLGPAVIRGAALTGSDPYLREGSDLAVLFHTTSPRLFLSAVEPFLDEAREKYGKELKHTKEDYHGITVESYQTPLREVSLHRAVNEQVVIYANSPVGLRRILDTYQGRHKALADALDFQYMRTIFRADDAKEDGFVYLSDAFIRQLVGPASKIKEKRRLEALTSLYMVTHAALFASWETGKLPTDHVDLLETAKLKPEEVYLPEGKPLGWNPKDQVAVSEVYNTLHFATPLIELPIQKVTPTEAADYENFRGEYMGLWRQYFDPIGMRVALDDRQVKIDTYILPLIRNTQYNELRRVTGEGTMSLDLATLAPQTVLQFMLHLSASVQDRGRLLGLLGEGNGKLLGLVQSVFDPVGNWVLFRLDDSAVYAKLMAQVEKMEAGETVDEEEVARLVFQVPFLVGMEVKNPLTLGAALAAARKGVQESLPGALTWGPLEKPYRDVQIVRIQATPTGMALVPRTTPRSGKERFLPTIYYAMIDGGFYLALNEATLHDFIDRARAPREGKAETVEISSSLHVSPGAPDKVQALLQKLLEKQVREQALSNEPIWHALYASGVLSSDADPKTARAVAERFLGFVPVSPDGSAYRYDRRTDEVQNDRHGSPRHPQAHAALAEDAPLNRLLSQLRSLRADLRFREDGIHTVLTLDRQPAGNR